MNFRNLIFKNFKKNIRNYLMFFFSSILAFISTFIFVCIFQYFVIIGNEGYIGYNVIYVILCLNILICVISVIFIDYALKNFVRLRAEDYNIFLYLGIQPKHMIYLVCIEYFSIIFYVIIIGGFLGQIIVNLASFFMKKANIIIKDIDINSMRTLGIIICIYIVIMILSLLLFYIKQRKIGITDMLNQIIERDSQRCGKMWKLYIGTLIGIILLVLSISLLVNYSVSKMIIAILINIVSIFMIFKYGGLCLIPLIKRYKKFYFKNIFQINNFASRFNQNKKILFIIYTINFLCIFIVGGFITSFLSGSLTTKDNLYPYDVVCHINDANEKNTRNLVKNLLNKSDKVEISFLNIKVKGKPAIAISASTYNNLTNENITLNDNEILYLEQRIAEEFKPIEEESIDILFSNKKYNFHIKNSVWKIVFGADLNEQLKKIVVFQDYQYENITNNKKQDGIILLKYKEGQNIIDEATVIKNTNDTAIIYFKSMLVGARNSSDSFLVIMIVIIGLLLILESGCIIYIKLFCDLDTVQNEYGMLNNMGMKRKRMVKAIKGEFRVNYLFPILISTIFGLIFFISDCYYQDNNAKEPIIMFVLITSIYLLGQVVFYSIVARKLVKSIIVE